MFWHRFWSFIIILFEEAHLRGSKIGGVACAKTDYLQYKPAKCVQIIVVYCVLYSIALNFEVPDPEDDLGIYIELT